MERLVDNEGVAWLYNPGDQLWYAPGRRPLTHAEMIERMTHE